jgi:pseudouridine kinase
VVITLGQEGLVASDAGGRLTLSAEKVQPVDVTGAGDALAAGLVYCWLRGEEDLGTACRFGLRLAALTVQTPHSVSCELEPRRADVWLEEARRGA